MMREVSGWSSTSRMRALGFVADDDDADGAHEGDSIAVESPLVGMAALSPSCGESGAGPDLVARGDVSALVVEATVIVGSVSVNVAQRPRPALAAVSSPWCTSASALLMARPSPKPPNIRVTYRPPCSKALKSRRIASGS